MAVTTRQFQLSMSTLPRLTSVLGKLGAMAAHRMSHGTP